MDWEVGSDALRELRPNQTRPGHATCPRDLDSRTACHSSHSTCTATIGPYRFHRHGGGLNHTIGYFCKCDKGYQGNPYLANGCQGDQMCMQFKDDFFLWGEGWKLICFSCMLVLDINECKLPDIYKCFGNCINLPGKFLCECPEGTAGNPSKQNGCLPPHDLDTGNNSRYSFQT